MIQVTDTIQLDERELQLEFVRAGGPGGQNVNKVASAVQLRFDVVNSPSLPEPVRARLLRLAANRITQDGVLVIDARAQRTQERNRQDAVNRLVALIRQAAVRPKTRHKTRPSTAERVRRLQTKRRTSEKKQQRRPPNWND